MHKIIKVWEYLYSGNVCKRINRTKQNNKKFVNLKKKIKEFEVVVGASEPGHP